MDPSGNPSDAHRWSTRLFPAHEIRTRLVVTRGARFCRNTFEEIHLKNIHLKKNRMRDKQHQVLVCVFCSGTLWGVSMYTCGCPEVYVFCACTLEFQGRVGCRTLSVGIGHTLGLHVRSVRLNQWGVE